MKLKTKTVRRLLLVAGVVAALSGTAFTLVVVRHWSKERTNAALRADGMAAVERGEYFVGLQKTGAYLTRTRDRSTQDPEVRLAYARARANVEEPDGTHLRDSIGFYRGYLALRPDDRDVRQEMMDVALRAGMFPEALDAARKLRPEDLSKATLADLPALRAESQALYQTNVRNQPLLNVLDRIAALDPLDLDSNIVRLDVLFQGGDRTAARRYADQLLEAPPDDPRALMIAALSRLQLGTGEDVAIARQQLAKAAGLDGAARRVRPVTWPDATSVLRMVEALDAVGLFAHTTQLLRDSIDAFDNLDLRRDLARRLWQDGALKEVVDRFGTIDPTDPRSDSVMLGLVALSKQGLGDAAGHKAALDALAARTEGDPRARAWTPVLRFSGGERGPSTPEAVDQLRAGIRAFAGEPVTHMALGDALANLGRLEEARAAWRAATEARDPIGRLVARGWATPYLRIAETLLAENRAVEAAQAATQAMSLAPSKVIVNVVFFEAQTARLLVNSADGPTPQALLERLEEADAALAAINDPAAAAMRERLTPSRVVYLARLGRSDEAKSVLRAALERAEKLDQNAVRRLAAISQSEGLGLEGEAMRRAEQAFGSTAEVVFARAGELAAAGRTAEGRALLEEAIRSRPDEPSFRIALARFLEGRDNPASIRAWEDVLGRYSSDPFVLRSLLGSAVATSDRALTDRAIAEYQKSIGRDGGEDVIVRVARARTLLLNNPGRAERDRAVGILNDVVQSHPTLVEPRRLLASALALSDPGRGIDADIPRAISQLAAALGTDPRSPDLLLELGRLEQARGEFERARDYLTRLADDRTVDPSFRTAAAVLLVAQGDHEPQARAALEDVARVLGERTPAATWVALGEIHRAMRRQDDARAAYSRAMEVATDSQSLFSVARFFASINDAQATQRAVDRIAQVDGRPWVTALARAQLAAERGDHTSAVTQFEDAVRATPDAADLWRQYAGYLLGRNDAAAAREVAERGLRSVPEDRTLVLVREQARMMLSPDTDPELTPLIASLAGQPGQERTVEMLRAIEAARVRGELNTVDQLNQLVNRYPGSVPLMMFAARKMLPLDGSASALMADRAMKAAPQDPQAARLAAEINLALGRWQDTLAAAQEWRRRDRSLSAEPDLAMAEALLNLNQLGRAIEVLQPHVQAAVASPRDPLMLGILNTYARALVLSNREADARALLRPIAQQHAAVRTFVWLNQATRFVPSHDVAARWIDELLPMVPPKEIDENLLTVNGLLIMADRFPEHTATIKARASAILETLSADSATATGPVFEAIGIIRHRPRAAPPGR
ncbi:tetratricopeptide repeat protein [Leptolyngbya sp. 15MV]|nr:tetratricopeptide repeat protein [Leptolyngbya sp. 15MV]